MSMMMATMKMTMMMAMLLPTVGRERVCEADAAVRLQSTLFCV